MEYLITGAAGFIGFQLSLKLIKKGFSVLGIDNMNNYYDIKLKESRLNLLKELSRKENLDFRFKKVDIANQNEIKKLFKKFNPRKVIHLAAQAGVRYSIKNPQSYVNSNLVGFNNIIDSCVKNEVVHFIFASSSSVYGGNAKIPFSEKDNVDHPISLYAATKRSNELVAHSYSHLFGLPSSGLRFFTVYGPWGRPDMALFKFTKAILENDPIEVYNYGDLTRDFTYIDDVTESIFRIINKIPLLDQNHSDYRNNPSASWAPFQIINIGNSEPIKLMDYIYAIELELNRKAKINFCEMQKGDVKITASDTSKLENLINYKPNTSIKNGVHKFVEWYRNYYKIN